MIGSGNAQCPMCGEEIDLGDGLEIGETIYCPECGGAVRVTRLNPPDVEEVEIFSEEEENSEDTQEEGTEDK
jgi:lysine biosynthesis protein LysW